MTGRLRTRLFFGLLALVIAGIGYSQIPAQKSEAVISAGSYQSFSYSTATQLATWVFTVPNSNDTFQTTLTFSAILPAGSLVISSNPATCGTLPSAAPVACTINSGVLSVSITVTTPFPQTCAAQVMTIGGLTYTQSSNFTAPVPLVTPGTTTVNGVPNTVPANLALCPTPIPNTPTPVPTPIPVVVPPPVIPQVFQQPVGGIFNGSRNDTPTPVRRAAPIISAPSTGQGPADSGITLRPPNTGDAGLLSARLLRRINAW